MLPYAAMHHHPYAVQTAALFIALVPFALLATMIAGARLFDGLHRARKPAPTRPAGMGVTRAANSAH